MNCLDKLENAGRVEVVSKPPTIETIGVHAYGLMQHRQSEWPWTGNIVEVFVGSALWDSVFTQAKDYVTRKFGAWPGEWPNSGDGPLCGPWFGIVTERSVDLRLINADASILGMSPSLVAMPCIIDLEHICHPKAHFVWDVRVEPAGSWIDRLYEECSQLQDRIRKLAMALHTGSQVPADQISILTEQLLAMRAYEKVLKRRISMATVGNTTKQ